MIGPPTAVLLAQMISDIRFKDFEDAIQHFTAKAEGGVTTIVTRNKTDFVFAEMPVQSPDQFLVSFAKA